MQRSLLCGLLAAVVAPGPAAAGDEASAKALDEYVRAHADNGDFSGVALVSRKGERVYGRGFGLASRPFEVPNREDTRFLVATVTKTFTAAGLSLASKLSRSGAAGGR